MDSPGNVSTLLVMCFAMFVGAFLAGYLPILFGISASKLRIFTIFGAGLLVGAALVIIIPEGVTMWYEALENKKLELEQLGGEHGEHDHAHAHEHEHEHSGHGHSESWKMGAAMTIGFGFMLLIDRISGSMGHGHSHSALPEPMGHSSEPVKTSSVMLGLMVHTVSDGVALGAAAFAGSSEATMLIFLAIILHKAPAAFGVSTFLAQMGLNNRSIRQQLIMLALCAPVGAIVTYYGMGFGLLGYEPSTLALIMLFSGGTFMFVASAHILPEVLQASGSLTWAETFVCFGGMIAPIFLSLDHGHGH